MPEQTSRSGRVTDQPVRAFFADTMLGKLARWLRILGYDTAYERDASDEMVIRTVLAENRWLLTRDRYLAQRRALRNRLTLIGSDHVVDQLRELAVAHHLNLVLSLDTPCRCADCNTVLYRVEKSRILGDIPPLVAVEQEVFSRCPQCKRVFWPGSHWQHIQHDLGLMQRH